MNMQVGKIAGAEPMVPTLNAGKLDTIKNCVECLEKLSKGDIAGALNELKEACDSAKSASAGAQKPAPGQGMDLYELLKQILEQGKKQSEANAAGQGQPAGGPAGAGNAGGAGGAQGAQQGGMAEVIQMLVQMLLQGLQKQGGAAGQAA